MKCLGRISPHDTPKNIQCCDNGDLCNQHLEPPVTEKHTTPHPGESRKYAHKVKSCYNPLRLGTVIALVSSGRLSEFPKDVGPPDKSGENLHGPMNAVSPPDQMSDNS